MNQSTNKWEKWLIWFFHIIPHHFISRIVFMATRMRGPFVQPFIRWFITRFDVDMRDAQYQHTTAYKTFNEFFTRPLKQGARPIVSGANTLASPADGTISEAGEIEQGKIFQAKGHDYSATDLLGGNEADARLFHQGQFATIYLAPYNYHRLHMPINAQLDKMIHVPGRLFSVAPWTVKAIPRIFARNERLVCLFSSHAGPIAMILVGAINVAAIETVWHGLVTPPRGRKVTEYDYSHTRKHYQKGDEMGRFNMGSTIILLMGEHIQWLPQVSTGNTVKVGELIGYYNEPKNGWVL